MKKIYLSGTLTFWRFIHFWCSAPMPSYVTVASQNTTIYGWISHAHLNHLLAQWPEIEKKYHTATNFGMRHKLEIYKQILSPVQTEKKYYFRSMANQQLFNQISLMVAGDEIKIAYNDGRRGLPYFYGRLLGKRIRCFRDPDHNYLLIRYMLPGENLCTGWKQGGNKKKTSSEPSRPRRGSTIGRSRGSRYVNGP